MARVTVKCRSCLTEFRIVTPEQTVTMLPPTFCLYCGSNDTWVHQNAERDYWEVMSEGFGLPVSILQMFYNAWHQDPEGQPKFRDYLQQAIRQVVEKKDVPTDSNSSESQS
jgi:hypothetical protein